MTQITKLAVLVICSGVVRALSQGVTAGMEESFDSTTPPALPAGWVSSRLRSASADDFATSTTAAHSAPNSVGCTNATLPQWLVTPPIDCSQLDPESISMVVRRSSSFAAHVLLEASLDDGASFPFPLGEAPSATGSYLPWACALPSDLGGNDKVRFRWRVVPDSVGTTGTFRMDDVSLAYALQDDLALSSLSISPDPPLEGVPFTIFVSVSNKGRRPAEDFWVNRRLDGASIPTATRVAGPLVSGDSTVCAIDIEPCGAGTHLLELELAYSPDGNGLNDRLTGSFVVKWRRGSLVVNEIMYAPAGEEPEWVELLNIRADSVAPGGWSISDAAVGVRHTIPMRTARVPPSGFMILTKDSAGFAGSHDGSFPVVGVPGFPTLNNSGDIVVLFDQTGAIIDSVAFFPSWGGATGGRSLERIDPYAPSTDSSNWNTTRLPSGCTPGVKNSVARKDRDLAVVALLADPDTPVAGDSATLTALIRNPGRNALDGWSARFFWDADRDSVPSSGELEGTVVAAGPLQPADSAAISLVVPVHRGGELLFIVDLACDDDEDMLNNRWYASFFVRNSGRALCINEILYAPPAEVPEWVELVNPGREEVELLGWRIGKESSQYTISRSSQVLPSGSFVVCTKDSALLRAAYPGTDAPILQVESLPTFCWNNGGDCVLLRDESGFVVDSFRYGPGWGGAAGRSLERRDPYGLSTDSSNWGSSLAAPGGTPGCINSIAVREHDLEVGGWRLCSGEAGAPLEVTVRNAGKLPGGPCRLSVFDDLNCDSVCAAEELVAESGISGDIPPGDSLLVYVRWHPPAPGRHLIAVVLEDPADENTLNNVYRDELAIPYPEGTVCVNEIMYAPLAGGGEYIELYNASESEVDLAGWLIHDRPTASGSVALLRFDSRRIVPAGGFFVVAADSSILEGFPPQARGPGEQMFVCGSGRLNLNNEGDDVVLTDPSSKTIDSVAYLSGWHNPEFIDCSGRALERIQPEGGSCDRRNWSTCVAPVGGTPGLPNSVRAQPIPSTSRLSFSPNPFSPDGDGHEDHVIIRYQVKIPGSVISIKIYDVRGRLIRQLANNEPSAASGSVVWDGFDDHRRRARIGIYIVFLEAIDPARGALETAKGAVVVAGRL